MSEMTTIFILSFLGISIVVAIAGWLVLSSSRISSSNTKSLSQQEPLPTQNMIANQEVEVTCPKCGASMEEGFIPDYAYGAIRRNEWVRGKPKLRCWLGGIDLSGRENLFITTYLCRACGYVESYVKN